MTSRNSFLRAIADDPEDDDLRLVFSDWLEENGDEVDIAAAELIRTQIALERLPPDDDQRAELRAIEERLILHESSIRQRLQASPWVCRGLSRGFPGRMGFDWNDKRKGWLSKEDLAGMEEVLSRLPIRTYTGDFVGCGTSTTRIKFPPAGQSGLEMLANFSGLARLTALEATTRIQPYEFSGNFSPGLRSLAESPYASGLRRLRLGTWQLDAESLTRVASSPSLANLVELDFAQDTISDEPVDVVGVLLGTPLAGRLERLMAGWMDVPATTVQAFLNRSRLRCLAFGVPEGSEDGVGPLIGSSGLARLRELHITGEEHGFDVDEMPDSEDHRIVPYLAEFLSSPELAGVETLSVRGVALGDDGVRALAGGAVARSLVELDLSLSGITGEGLQALRPLITHGRLRRLTISHNAITNSDAVEMASWPEFNRLHLIDVGFFTLMGDEGRTTLEESRNRHPWLKVL
jgi:uncharacterized protein (TIGR02996 family)